MLIGVVDVVNEIEIAAKVSPEQVRSKIESALQRSACKEARRINVEAVGEKVVLRGEVHSWAEREDAERAAWNAPGVSWVEDDLRVRS